MQKAPINTDILKKNKSRQEPHKAQCRTQQTQSRRPPDNGKMTDKRRKQTKPHTKCASSGIKETYHRKTSRQAIKQPEAHGPTNTATPSLRSSAFRSIKKAADPTEKKPKSADRHNFNRQNTPHTQSPLFQRLRAAPARAKPPVNFGLDRQGRKEEKASRHENPQQKMRKKTSNSQSVQKNVKKNTKNA